MSDTTTSDSDYQPEATMDDPTLKALEIKIMNRLAALGPPQPSSNGTGPMTAERVKVLQEEVMERLAEASNGPAAASNETPPAIKDEGTTNHLPPTAPQAVSEETITRLEQEIADIKRGLDASTSDIKKELDDFKREMAAAEARFHADAREHLQLELQAARDRADASPPPGVLDIPLTPQITLRKWLKDGEALDLPADAASRKITWELPAPVRMALSKPSFAERLRNDIARCTAAGASADRAAFVSIKTDDGTRLCIVENPRDWFILVVLPNERTWISTADPRIVVDDGDGGTTRLRFDAVIEGGLEIPLVLDAGVDGPLEAYALRKWSGQLLSVWDRSTPNPPDPDRRDAVMTESPWDAEEMSSPLSSVPSLLSGEPSPSLGLLSSSSWVPSSPPPLSLPK